MSLNVLLKIFRVLRVWCAVLLPLPAFAAPLPECKLLVASGNPEYPPYLWRDPRDETRLVGAVADFMDLLAAQIEIPIQVRYVGPWARVQEEVRAGRTDLIAGAFLTKPRQEYMNYFKPPIAATRSVVIVPSGSTLHYRAWADLAGRRGLTVFNNSFGEDFDRYAEKNLTIEKVTKLENALKMLTLQRADYLIYEDAPARAIAARLNIKGLVEMPTAISNEDLYLTLSHRSACNSDALRARLAQALQKLSREKVMDGLLSKAIQNWRTQN